MNTVFRVSFSSIVVAAVFAAGCNSPRSTTRPEESLQPVLMGDAVFDTSTIEVNARITPFRPAESSHRPVRRDGDRADIEDLVVGGRPPPREGGMGGGIRFGGEERPSGGRRGGVGLGAIRQTITVVFRNTGEAPVRVRVVEVSSALGNFVPIPETFTIERGATQALEPMLSAYPENLEELSVLVRIRTEAGDDEQSVMLKRAVPAAPGESRDARRIPELD